MKTRVQRTKPHVNIGTIGHVDHKKPSNIDKVKQKVDKLIKEYFTGK